MADGVLSAAEFAQRFPREGTRVEFKGGAGTEPLRKSMVAMWNAFGGTIHIGVEDSGLVVGVQDPGAAIATVHDASRDIRDIGRYDTRVVEVAGRAVVEVHLDPKVHGFAQLSDGRVLVRRGEHDMPVFGGDLAAFVMSRQLQRFESQPTTLTVDDADPDAVDDLVDVHGWEPERENVIARLRDRGLLDPAGGDRLTVAGALFLTTADVLGKAYVEVRRYPDDGDAYDKRERFDGPLQTQVRAATKAVIDELGYDFVVTGVERHEMPKLPREVVREAIANAVAHRSYEVAGTPTVVEIRPGKVVVRSPGGLPEGVTIDNLRDSRSSRNNVVIDVLRQFGVAEDAGRGVGVMQDRMAEALLDPPRFSDLGTAFEVTLPVHSAISPEERAWVLDVEHLDEITARDRLLLVHAARGEPMTNAFARSVLGVDSTEARAALRRLISAGLLQQHGTRGGATYALGPAVRPRGPMRLLPEEMDRVVLEQAAVEPVTNAMVRQLTGLSESQARSLLNRLVDAGLLVRSGSRRWTRYVLP